MPEFCQFCGSELKEGVKFCTHCGAPVQQTAQPASVPDAQQQVQQPQQQVQQQPQQQVQQPRQQVQQPRQTDTAQPQPADQQPASKKAKKGKKKKRKGRLIVFLAIIAIGAVLYFGFRDGGWFRRKSPENLESLCAYAERLEKDGNKEAAAAIYDLIAKAGGELIQKAHEDIPMLDKADEIDQFGQVFGEWRRKER